MTNINKLYHDYDNGTFDGYNVNVLTQRTAYSVPKNLIDSLLKLTQLNEDYWVSMYKVESIEGCYEDIAVHTNNVVKYFVEQQHDSTDVIKLELTKTESRDISCTLYQLFEENDFDVDFDEETMNDLKKLTEIFHDADADLDNEFVRLQDWLQ